MFEAAFEIICAHCWQAGWTDWTIRSNCWNRRRPRCANTRLVTGSVPCRRVTAKNNLQQQVNDMRKRIDALNAKADAADADGNTETAQKLRRERDAYQKIADGNGGITDTGRSDV